MKFVVLLVFVMVAALTAAVPLCAQTTAFTYQGSLNSSGSPATGNYDFEFALFDAASGGTQLGATNTRAGVSVTNGVFAVSLDFGNQFPGASRYLEIRVRPTGGGSFTTLNPRQPVSSSPYSVKSISADTAASATNATNATNAVNAANASTANNALQLGGVAASQYVLTTDPRMADARPPTAGSANYIQNQNSGAQAGSNFNISGNGTAGGTISGNIVNATTQYNIGGSAFLSTTGTNNTFVGLNLTYLGAYNTMVGFNAGLTNTGSHNTFFGMAAGVTNTSGDNNSMFGRSAGNNRTGSDNAFFGSFAGSAASFFASSGNSFFGTFAGGGITNNTSIGYNARNTGFGSANLINSTAIGSYAAVSQNHSLILGSIDGVNGCNAAANCASVNVGIGTTAPGARLHIVDNGGSTLIGDPTGCPVNFGGLGFSSTLTCGNYSLLGDGLNTYFNRPTGGQIFFRENNADQMAIISGGNVGVGTTGPQQRLSISDGMNIDQNNLNSGTLTNTLRFGPGNSGEAIGSRRTAGGNQYGLDFYTASSNRMSVTVGGDVGIGVTPTSKLHVYGGGSVRITADSDANAGIGLALSGQTKWSIATVSPGQLQIYNQVTNSNAVWIDTSNRVGIGTASPDQTLTVGIGNASKPGGGSWATFSDARLKNIMGRFTPGLNAVLRLQPLRYEYKEDNALGIRSEGEHIGFSAQEVQRIIPEAVTKNDKGFLLINNDPIMWTMLNAIKEQQAQIERQQAEIDILKALLCDKRPKAKPCKLRN